MLTLVLLDIQHLQKVVFTFDSLFPEETACAAVHTCYIMDACNRV